MKLGWKGCITNSADETIKLGEEFSNFLEIGDVFAFEGEGGLSTGVTLETLNSAWGLGLGNLVYYIDWNDFGIDSRPFSSIVKSTPQELFETSGWHVEGTNDCEDWSSFTEAYYDLIVNKSNSTIPKMIFV